MKYWFELMSLYQFFHVESEFQAKTTPKPPQNPILTKFSKNPIFIKIAKNRRAAAPAGGLLN